MCRVTGRRRRREQRRTRNSGTGEPSKGGRAAGAWLRSGHRRCAPLPSAPPGPRCGAGGGLVVGNDNCRWLGLVCTKPMLACPKRGMLIVAQVERYLSPIKALSSPFMQGKPNSPCMNSKCSNWKKRGQLTTLALMPAEPLKGVHTFGRWGGGVQLIFQLCPKCCTIRVSNQCD